VWRRWPRQGDDSCQLKSSEILHTMSKTSSRSSRSERNWADVEVEGQEDLNPSLSATLQQRWDLSSNGSRSSTSSSVPSQQASHGASGSSGHRGNTRPKLINRGLTKEELADSVSTTSSGRSAGGTPYPNNQTPIGMASLSSNNVGRNYCQPLAGDDADDVASGTSVSQPQSES